MPADGKLPPDESKLAAVPYPHPLLQSETKGSPFCGDCRKDGFCAGCATRLTCGQACIEFEKKEVFL